MITIKKNVGKTDALIRYGIGVALIIAGFYTKDFLWLFLILAVISIGTGYFKTCGIYSVFGLNTCEVKEEDPKE